MLGYAKNMLGVPGSHSILLQNKLSTRIEFLTNNAYILVSNALFMRISHKIDDL